MKKLILFLSLLLSLNTRASTAPVLLGGNTNDQVLFVFFLSNGITNADRIIAGLNTNGTLKFNTNLIAYGFLPIGQTNWIFTGATNSAWLASLGLTNGQYVAATNSAWLASLGLTNIPYAAGTNKAKAYTDGQLTGGTVDASFHTVSGLLQGDLWRGANATNLNCWSDGTDLPVQAFQDAFGHYPGFAVYPTNGGPFLFYVGGTNTSYTGVGINNQKDITNLHNVYAVHYYGDGSGLTGISGGGGVTSNGFQTNLTAVGTDNKDALTISSTSSNNAIALTAVDNHIVALPPSDTNANGNNIFISGSRSGPNGSIGGAVYLLGGPSTNGNSGPVVIGDTNFSTLIVSPSDHTAEVRGQFLCIEVDISGGAATLLQDGTFTTTNNISWGLAGDFHAKSLILTNAVYGDVASIFENDSGNLVLATQGDGVDTQGGSLLNIGGLSMLNTGPFVDFNGNCTATTLVVTNSAKFKGDLTVDATNTPSFLTPNGTKVYMHLSNPSVGTSTATFTTTP